MILLLALNAAVVSAQLQQSPRRYVVWHYGDAYMGQSGSNAAEDHQPTKLKKDGLILTSELSVTFIVTFLLATKIKRTPSVTHAPINVSKCIFFLSHTSDDTMTMGAD